MPESVYEVNQRFIAAIHAQDAQASQQLFDAWAKAREHIQTAIAQLNAQIARAEAQGQFSPAWIYRQDRLANIDSTVLNQMAELARVAGVVITENQQQAINQGQAFSEQSAIAQLGGASAMATANISWGRLNPAAVEDMVGFLADGSPLKSLLDQIPQQTAGAIRQALIDGVVQHRNPNVTAAIIKRETAAPLVRATRIARTETLRAYRTASLRSMQANPQIVEGWVWLASLSRRTCPVCLAMNGTWHPLTEQFASHVSCRCCPVPSTRPWSEILGDPDTDIPDTSVDVSTNAGWDFYQRQSVAVQNQMVGPGKRRLIEELQVQHNVTNPLRTLVGFRNDPEWGPERYERSLRDLRAELDAGHLPSENGVHALDASHTPPQNPNQVPQQPAAAPPPTPTPASSPAPTPQVSAALDVPGPVKNDPRQVAIDAIDSVHTDGVLPPIPVISQRLGQGTNGYFRRRGVNLDPLEIVVSNRGPWRSLTATHEIGHFIDWSALGAGTAFGSESAPELQAWRDAVAATDAYDHLKQIQQTRTIQMGNGITGKIPQKDADYYISWRELWARSYSQFIATNCTSAKMKSDLDTSRASDQCAWFKTQWTDQDFSAINDAIRALFQSKGWM